MREVDLNPPAMPDPGEGRRWFIKNWRYVDELSLQERRTFLGVPYWATLRDQSFFGYSGADPDDGTEYSEKYSYQDWANWLGRVLLKKQAQAERLSRERAITYEAING